MGRSLHGLNQQGQRRQHLGFLISLSRAGQRRRDRVGLEVVDSHTSENGVSLYHTMYGEASSH